MLQVQRASAGSGKTEQLARRYLQLFFQPKHAALDPRAVVATTFTREAAGEIVARIFRLLARACQEERFRLSLAQEINLPILTKENCDELLRRFVDHVDRLSIGTIDALFAEQARLLALDLGIASPWEIADSLTSEELAREALLHALRRDPSIREAWSLLHHGTRVLSFVEKGTSLFEKNRWVARAYPRDKNFLKPGDPQLFLEREKVQTFLKNFEVPLNSKGKPDGRWIKALAQLQKFFWRPLLLKDLLEGGALLKKCAINSLPTFYGTPIPSEFVTFFTPFVEASIQEQQRLEALREAALGRMIQQYELVRQEISFCAGKYTFSEIEEAVQSEHHQLSIDEIALRIDLRTEHLLLDEYQDTSQQQHNFLSPLVGNVLAKGGEVFVVGDVKQGIYGWRGGKRHLLSLLEKEHEVFKKTIAPLDQSYRSSRAVLEAVNQVFGALKNREAVTAMEGGIAFEKAAAKWSADFEAHVGASSVEDLIGRVRVHAIKEAPEEETDPMDEIIQKAVTLVEEHLREDRSREIGILVRRTKLIAPLLQQLQARNILASGEGGNPLADTVAVELILSLLTWIEHPGNTAAYQHLFYSPLQHLVTQKNATFLLRAQLYMEGIAPTLRSWISNPAFQAACSAYESGRLEQLIMLVEKYEAGGERKLSSLVKRLRQERVETPLPAKVRVLTFHASKGLEFESVILIDLDVDITAGGERSIRVQQDEAGDFFIQGGQEMMTLQGRSALLTSLQEEQWAEMLSLLYVGMTRAASYLDLLFFEQPSRKKTMAQWLRVSGLGVHEVKGKPLRLLKPAAIPSPQAIPEQRPSSRTYQKLFQRLPSEEENGGVVSLAQLLQGRSAREQGTMVHAELAQIEWGDKNEIFQKEIFLEKWRSKAVTQLELWRERKFAVVHAHELISGIFDRVVIGKNEQGIPIIAEIIDFKTGDVEQREELERRYEPQMRAYRTALQEMLPSLKEVTTSVIPANAAMTLRA